MQGLDFEVRNSRKSVQVLIKHCTRTSCVLWVGLQKSGRPQKAKFDECKPMDYTTPTLRIVLEYIRIENISCLNQM